MLIVLHEKYIRWSRLITQLKKRWRARTAFAFVDISRVQHLMNRKLPNFKKALLVL